MTENGIVNALMRGRWQTRFCLPRYTPSGWWECDLFELTDAGYFTEYEVKLSVADFRIDAKKAKDNRSSGRYVNNRLVYDRETKHDLLARGDPRAPSRFYYVTPPNLLSYVTLPRWAGWIEMMTSDAAIYPRVRVKAPRIHKHKLEPTENHHRGTCYFRMHLRQGRAALKD